MHVDCLQQDSELQYELYVRIFRSKRLPKIWKSDMLRIYLEFQMRPMKMNVYLLHKRDSEGRSLNLEC
jgi:hypothetical protein